MANITKSFEVALAHQLITHPNSVIGSAISVATKLAMKIYLFHASVEATANTNPGKFLIQFSGAESGNEDWITVAEFDATISTADTEAISGAEAIGQTVIEVAATAGFASRDRLYIQDAGVVADGEWILCKKIVTDTSIDLTDGLTKAKDNSDIIWNDADKFTASFDLTDVARYRIVFLHEGNAGANCHIKAMASYGDSIG